MFYEHIDLLGPIEDVSRNIIFLTLLFVSIIKGYVECKTNNQIIFAEKIIEH